MKLNAVRAIQETVVQGTGVGTTHAVDGMGQEEAAEEFQNAFALTIDGATAAIETVESVGYRQIQQDSRTAAATAAAVTAATATASNPLLLLAATPAAVLLPAAVPPAAVPGVVQDPPSSVELSSGELSPHVHAVPGTSKYLV
jgi:hypothetical protein